MKKVLFAFAFLLWAVPSYAQFSLVEQQSLKQIVTQWIANGQVIGVPPGGGILEITFEVPAQYSIAGSPAEDAQSTLTLGWQNQAQKTFLSGPTSGSDAAPTFRLMVKGDTPATTVHTDQANTFSGSARQDFSGAILEVPQIAGTVGTNTGDIGINTVAQQLEIAINSTNKVVALTDGNIATATALAANPADCTVTATNVGVFAYAINASGTLSCKISHVKTTADPTANDDSGDGYIAGVTRWTNTSGTANERVWCLIDDTAAAAVWDLCGSAGSAQGLDANFDVEKEIDGANSLANAMRVGDGVTPLCMYTDATYGAVSKPCTDADRKTLVATDFEWALWDEENNAAILTSDPDATSTGVGTLTMGTGQKFVGSARGINVGSVAGDPSSPANGDIWYDSTANKFNCRENGSSVDCIGGGGATITTLHTFRPAQAEFPTSNAATLDTRNTRSILDFDASTDESVYFSDIMNRGYSGAGLVVNLHTAMTSATSDNVIMCAAFERIGAVLDIDGDSFDTAVCSAATAVSGTSGVVTVIELTFADNAAVDAIAVGEGFRLQVYRDANDAGDTATGDLELLFVEVKQ